MWAGQNGVKVMLKRAYSSYQRTEWFKITPKLLDPWICNLLMVQLNSTHLLPLVSGKLEAQKLNHLKAPSHLPSVCCWLPFGHIGFLSWGSLMLLLLAALSLFPTGEAGEWWSHPHEGPLCRLTSWDSLAPNTVPSSPRVSISWKVNHLEAVFFSLPRHWCHMTSILPCLLLGSIKSKSFHQIKKERP